MDKTVDSGDKSKVYDLDTFRFARHAGLKDHEAAGIAKDVMKADVPPPVGPPVYSPPIDVVMAPTPDGRLVYGHDIRVSVNGVELIERSCHIHGGDFQQRVVCAASDLNTLLALAPKALGKSIVINCMAK